MLKSSWERSLQAQMSGSRSSIARMRGGRCCVRNTTNWKKKCISSTARSTAICGEA
nr:MAG TPA: hypothetical protein [Caudoviricetes sp.]